MSLAPKFGLATRTAEVLSVVEDSSMENRFSENNLSEWRHARLSGLAAFAIARRSHQINEQLAAENPFSDVPLECRKTRFCAAISWRH